MITVGTFSKPEDAHMLRMRLEAGGVTAYLRDEHLVQMNWLYSNAVGGVRVEIAEEDLDSAREILRDEGSAAGEAEKITCPACGSEDTRPHELPRRLSFLAILLAGFPLHPGKNVWRCDACRNRWNR